jgi:hypothetical protein
MPENNQRSFNQLESSGGRIVNFLLKKTCFPCGIQNKLPARSTCPDSGQAKGKLFMMGVEEEHVSVVRDRFAL